METVLILVAVVACVIAAVVVGTLVTRSRRAPMRMRSDLDEADEALVLASVAPPRSPIDRTAPVLELEPVKPDPDAPEPRRIPGPEEGGAR